MADVNPAGEGIAKELNEQYGKGTAVFLKTDVSKPEDVERMFQVGDQVKWRSEFVSLIASQPITSWIRPLLT